jgi:hypothetical protein
VDFIGLTALGGLAFALLVHAALLVLASLTGEQRSLAYPALAILTASLLAWQGVVAATWLPATIGLLLLLASAAVLIARRRWPRLPSLSRVEWLALLLLVTAAPYSAFPDYRPDQWNNDLVLAKAVSGGPLRPPIFEEHVYYGGNYQYFFTLPRWLSGDDMFNHGAADSFSWLLLVFGLAGLLARMRSEAFPRLPPVSLLLIWAVFSIPEPTALVNAKPDPLILVAALAVIELSSGPRHEDSRGLHGFLLGFLLVAPLALKITWALFLCAGFLAWLFLLVIRRPPPSPARRFFVTGVLVGLLASVPYLLTNWKFFGNPLHPAQFGPFLRSTYWGESFSLYHNEVAGRAASAPEYLATLAHLVPMLSWHLYSMLTPVLLILLAALLRGQRPGPIGTRGATVLRHAIVAGAFFLLSWPVFFRSNIYPRFLYPGVALVLVALLGVLDRTLRWGGAPPATGMPPAWLRRLAVAALFLPVALADGLPRQVAFMARFGLVGRERLLAEGPPEWRMARDLLLVNQHRRRVSPAAGYFARTTLLDMEGSYLLDSAAFRLWSREYQWLESPQGKGAECPWLTLSRLDVAYLRTRFRFELWPESYRRVIRLLPALDDSGRIRYLDPQLLASRAASEFACDEASVGARGVSHVKITQR